MKFTAISSSFYLIAAHISLVASFSVQPLSPAIRAIDKDTTVSKNRNKHFRCIDTSLHFFKIPGSDKKNALGSDQKSTENSGGVLITELEAELIAKNLREMIDLPMVPNPIEKIVVKQIIMAFCEIAPVVLSEEVFIQLVSGEQDSDAVSEEIIREISDKICIPIISRDVQDSIVDKVCAVMFTSASSKKVKRQMIARSVRDSLNQNSKEELATKLNNMIDIPFVSEEKEQEMAEAIINSAAKTFEKVVPEPVRDMLMTTSPEELRGVRSNLILRLNEMIDIPFKSEAEEEEMIENIVDFLLQYYGLAEGTKTPEEELEDVERELTKIDIQIEAQRMVNEDKEEDFLNKKASLQKRKQTLEGVVSDENLHP